MNRLTYINESVNAFIRLSVVHQLNYSHALFVGNPDFIGSKICTLYETRQQTLQSVGRGTIEREFHWMLFANVQHWLYSKTTVRMLGKAIFVLIGYSDISGHNRASRNLLTKSAFLLEIESIFHRSFFKNRGNACLVIWRQCLLFGLFANWSIYCASLYLGQNIDLLHISTMSICVGLEPTTFRLGAKSANHSTTAPQMLKWNAKITAVFTTTFDFYHGQHTYQTLYKICMKGDWVRVYQG